MVDEVYIDKVIEQAKKNILREGDIDPMFLVMDSHENMVAYEAGWDDDVGKQEVHKWLDRTVNELGSKRYFYVSTGWVVMDSDMLVAFHDKRKVLLENINAETVKAFFKDMFELVTFPPALSPAKKEVIIVSEFEKGVGTKTVNLAITRNETAISFGAPVVMTDVPKSYNWWNVWSPLQITVGGEEEAQGVEVHNKRE